MTGVFRPATTIADRAAQCFQDENEARTPALGRWMRLAAGNADGTAKSKCRQEDRDPPHRVLHTIDVPTHQRRCARTQVGVLGP